MSTRFSLRALVLTAITAASIVLAAPAARASEAYPEVTPAANAWDDTSGLPSVKMVRAISHLVWSDTFDETRSKREIGSEFLETTYDWFFEELQDEEWAYNNVVAARDASRAGTLSAEDAESAFYDATDAFLIDFDTDIEVPSTTEEWDNLVAQLDMVRTYFKTERDECVDAAKAYEAGEKSKADYDEFVAAKRFQTGATQDDAGGLSLREAMEMYDFEGSAAKVGTLSLTDGMDSMGPVALAAGGIAVVVVAAVAVGLNARRNNAA